VRLRGGVTHDVAAALGGELQPGDYMYMLLVIHLKYLILVVDVIFILWNIYSID
jgi:hypothetical protein